MLPKNGGSKKPPIIQNKPLRSLSIPFIIKRRLRFFWLNVLFIVYWSK